MNHLRSTAVLAASASLIALVAGCNEATDTTEETAPSTEISSHLDPQYTPPVTTICPQDVGVSTEKAYWYQVQASRVAKYLMGGVDPWDNTPGPDGNPIGWGPEYGPAGLAAPDTGSAECQAASKCVHHIHDKLYPAAAKCDARQQKDGRCPTTTATASLTSGPNGKACELPADTFQISVNTTDPDWPDMATCALNLDGCWAKGVSGFFWVMEGVTDPNRKSDRVNILGVDPEPASMKATLTGSTGATAAAVYTSTGLPTQAILWPGTFAPGSTAPAGTPCSTYGLAPGDLTTKAIVVSGVLRKCT